MFQWRYMSGNAGDAQQGYRATPCEESLSGAPPNLLHVSDTAHILGLRQWRESARALAWALTGNESSGILSAPANGHKHDEGSGGGLSTLLDWLQIGSWRPSTTTIDTSVEVGYKTTSTSEAMVGFFGLVVPAGAARVIPSARIRVAAGGIAAPWVHLRFFAPTSLDTATIDAPLFALNCDTTIAAVDAWCTGSPIDLSGFGLTNGVRLVFCRVDFATTSGSTSSLREIQLAIPAETRTPSLVAIDASAYVPMATISQTLPKADWVDNPANVRNLIFGLTPPPLSLPHDHGAQGGETLGRMLLSVDFGPQNTAGELVVTGGTAGVPLHAPQSGVTSFVSSPKLLEEVLLFVPGGVGQVRAHAVVNLPGASNPKTMTLKLEVRPLSDVGFSSPGANLGIVGTASYSLAGATKNFAQVQVNLDLRPFGHVGDDRVYSLALSQAHDADAAQDARLISIVVYAGTAPTDRPEPRPLWAPKKEISVAKIRKEQVIDHDRTTDAARVLRQLSYEALGGCPGLSDDLFAVDTSRPWKQSLPEPHQHRGRRCLHWTGQVFNDGACLRHVLWAQVFGVGYGEDGSSPTLVTGDPPLGFRLTSAGQLGSGQPRFAGRVSIPQGLGALEVYALVQPLTSAIQGRLWLAAALYVHDDYAVNPTNYVTGTRSGPYVYNANFTASHPGIYMCLVDPVDAPAWQDVGKRRRAGLGNWTTDALAPTTPTGISTTNIARWTQPLRVEISPQTGNLANDYALEIRGGIQTGSDPEIVAGSGWTTTSRVLAIVALSAGGY